MTDAQRIAEFQKENARLRDTLAEARRCGLARYEKVRDERNALEAENARLEGSHRAFGSYLAYLGSSIHCPDCGEMWGSKEAEGDDRECCATLRAELSKACDAYAKVEPASDKSALRKPEAKP